MDTIEQLRTFNLQSYFVFFSNSLETIRFRLISITHPAVIAPYVRLRGHYQSMSVKALHRSFCW